jgi:ABC-type polysaccharide/polyol phosphate export permease
VPESMQNLMKINPILIYVDLFRQALLKHEFDMINIVICIFFSLLTFVLGTLFFDRLKYSFSDVL